MRIKKFDFRLISRFTKWFSSIDTVGMLFFFFFSAIVTLLWIGVSMVGFTAVMFIYETLSK